MAFVIADDKVEDFLKEKADKNKLKQIYKMAERFEKHHKPKPQSQADKIRAMSDEELAEFLTDYLRHPCKYCIGCKVECHVGMAEWLKSEVKE